MYACGLADTPTRPYADTASFVVAAMPRCVLRGLLCKFFSLLSVRARFKSADSGSDGASPYLSQSSVACVIVGELEWINSKRHFSYDGGNHDC